jgi:hypothetical protein
VHVSPGLVHRFTTQANLMKVSLQNRDADLILRSFADAPSDE